jgi:hypothetical protein
MFTSGETVAEPDPALRRIERHSVIACAALAVAAGIVTRGVEAPLGVLGGGALVAISYRGIKAGISTVVDTGHGGASGGSRLAAIGARGLVKFFTRYAILAVAAYVIMARLRLPPVAVFAGASSLVIAVMVEALRGVSHGR